MIQQVLVAALAGSAVTALVALAAHRLASAKAMVSSMTLVEQANQMRGTNPQNLSNYSDIFRTPDDTTKGVKGFLFRDGSRGVSLAAPTLGEFADRRQRVDLWRWPRQFQR